MPCRRFCSLIALLLGAWGAAGPASAAFVPVYGGPTYDQTTLTGYRNQVLPAAPGSTAGNGVAVGQATKYSSGTDLGARAFRWDASGSPATELGNLGTDSNGITQSRAYTLNTAGAAVGYAQKYTGDTYLGYRAVRWDALASAATELGNLGTDSSGSTTSFAYAINTAGAAVGFAAKWSGDTILGERAVRWDASGTAATELGNLGTDSSGGTLSSAYAVNTAGAAVGYAAKYTGWTYLGSRAVRWDASSTAATELGNLGTDSSGVTDSLALAVNTAGTAAGYASKYTGSTYRGIRAIRWDASSTAATELGHLGTTSSGSTNTYAYATNTTGAVVGYAAKFTGDTGLGTRAVRWDASGTAATELGNLGTDIFGVTYSEAYAINTAGLTIGYARKYTAGTNLGDRAVLWNFDAIPIDLNTLIDPNSGWTLYYARGISDTNWVSGTGLFDPDGAGPLAAYDRAFLLNVSSIVPEPGSLLTLAMVLLGLRSARRL